jgi:hypothetical protein
MVSVIALDRLCDFAFSLSIHSQDKTTDWRGHAKGIERQTHPSHFLLKLFAS